jgi:hypothetical protein
VDLIKRLELKIVVVLKMCVKGLYPYL